MRPPIPTPQGLGVASSFDTSVHAVVMRQECRLLNPSVTIQSVLSLIKCEWWCSECLKRRRASRGRGRTSLGCGHPDVGTSGPSPSFHEKHTYPSQCADPQPSAGRGPPAPACRAALCPPSLALSSFHPDWLLTTPRPSHPETLVHILLPGSSAPTGRAHVAWQDAPGTQLRALEGAATSPLGEPPGVQAGDHEQEPFQAGKQFLSECVCVCTQPCARVGGGEGECKGALIQYAKDSSPMPLKLSGCHSQHSFLTSGPGPEGLCWLSWPGSSCGRDSVSSPHLWIWGPAVTQEEMT